MPPRRASTRRALCHPQRRRHPARLPASTPLKYLGFGVNLPHMSTSVTSPSSIVAAAGGTFLLESRTPAEVFTPEDLSEEQRQIAEPAQDAWPFGGGDDLEEAGQPDRIEFGEALPAQTPPRRDHD